MRSGPEAPQQALLHRSWQRVAGSVTARALDGDLFATLVSAYSEAHRHYHALQHLCECLAAFETVQALAVRPAEVELALWFHDAVYNTQRHDNEQKSADWAQQALLHHGAVEAVAQRVHTLVMATRHTAMPASGDEQLLVDIDLSILGALPPRFAQYEQQIRDEYAFVPDGLFREKRREVLQGFLGRPAIYSTGYFRDQLEARARSNLCRAIADTRQDKAGP